LWYFEETVISEKMFGRNSNIKFNENSPCGSQVVPGGLRDITRLLLKI